jgi:hypothetical protein
MNIPGSRRVQLSDLPLIDADVGTVIWVENLGFKYEAVPRSAKSTGAVDGPADALTPISWQPSGMLVTTPGGTFSASRMQVEGSIGTVVSGTLMIDLDNSLPGYPELMALQPRRLIMPTRRSGRTHLIDTGTSIKQLSDLSGYGLHQSQAVHARMPVQGMASLDPAPHFTYASQSYTEGTCPIGAGGQAAWTRVYGFYLESDSVFGSYKSSGGSNQFFINNAGAYIIAGCTRTMTAISTGAMHLLVMAYDGAQLTDALKCQLYLDGSVTPMTTAASSGSASATLPACTTDSIGWNFAGSAASLTGCMALMADFPFAASGASLTALHAACLLALESL